MAKIMFNQYNTKAVSININKAYFFQAGIYTDLNKLKEESDTYDSYIYVKEKDKYYVYIGITLNNKDKLKEYFDGLNYVTSIKEIEVSDDFALQLEQYDEKLTNLSNKTDIKNITNDILKKYEELND